ncbi:hypothetical protein Bca101_058996 [Brassica carinata]
MLQGTPAPCRGVPVPCIWERPFHVYGNARSMYMGTPVPCIWERPFHVYRNARSLPGIGRSMTPKLSDLRQLADSRHILTLIQVPSFALDLLCAEIFFLLRLLGNFFL